MKRHRPNLAPSRVKPASKPNMSVNQAGSPPASFATRAFTGRAGDAQASLLKGDPIIGDPSKWLNLIHIDDAAMVGVKALDHAPPGSLFIATDSRPVQRSEFYGLIAKLLGASDPTFIIPEPGSPESRREESNKRASNRKLLSSLIERNELMTVESGIPDALGSRPIQE